MTDRDFKEPKVNYKTPVAIMDDPFYLLSRCIYAPRPCYIAMLDGEYDQKLKEIKPDYFRNLDIIANTTDSDNYYQSSGQVHVVNATCHLAILKSFKLQFSDLPTMLVYNGQQEQAYRMGKNTVFNLSNVVEFLESSNKKDMSHYQITKKEVEVNRVDCSKVTEIRNRDFKFDYGGYEFEEVDTDENTMSIEEDSHNPDNLNSNFNKQYVSNQKKDDL